ncbi:hypothetical protein [Streptomyces sp. NPDC059597]|uniref:hypothetical protein n=1 Tax=Streptomyces sp. NPDC059597 TaxID=3346879 RepID=UPI0036CC1DB2
MRINRVIAATVSPLVAASVLAFTPTLMSQASAETPQAAAASAAKLMPKGDAPPNPANAGKIAGRQAGTADGNDCTYSEPSRNPIPPANFTKKKDIGKYSAAYNKAYDKAFDAACDEGD